MITHDARWSLPRGKNPVPSSWQTTATGPHPALCVSGHNGRGCLVRLIMRTRQLGERPGGWVPATVSA
jgi:hypothetical protein